MNNKNIFIIIIRLNFNINQFITFYCRIIISQSSLILLSSDEFEPRLLNSIVYSTR